MAQPFDAESLRAARDQVSAITAAKAESVRAAVYDDCPYCKGRGKVKSSITMSVEIQRKIGEIMRKLGQPAVVGIGLFFVGSVLCAMYWLGTSFLGSAIYAADAKTLAKLLGLEP